MERAGPGRTGPASPQAAGTLAGGTPPGAAGGRLVRDPDTAPLPALGRLPVLGHLALLLCYLTAGVAVTWPRATYLAGLLPSSRDSASYVWDLWWIAHLFSHPGNPWFTDSMAAPAGLPLGFHTLLPLPGLLLAPVTATFGPVTSYNLLVLITPGLLCYGTFRVARLWLPSVAGAVAAGAFFGLSAMLTQEAWYHLNIALGTMFLPLALEASVRLRRTPGTRQGVILGLVMGAAVLTDQESAVLAAIVTGLTLVPWLAWRPSLAKMRPAALATGVGMLIASPQIAAMVQEVAAGGLTISRGHALVVSYKQYGIGLPGMFAPTPRVADFGLTALAAPFLHSRDNEQLPMFGTVLTVLALAGLAAAWRRRSAWQLAALWLGSAALALGASLWLGKVQYLPLMSWWHQVRVSEIMPYTWFVRIPGLSSFREADRLALLGMMPAALLAGSAVSWLAGHLRRGGRLRYMAGTLLVVVAGLAVLEAGYSGSKWPDGKPKIGTFRASFAALDRPIARDRSHSVVVDLPFGIRGGIPVYGLRFDPRALVMATQDGHPRAIGYVSRLPVPVMNAMNAHPFYHYLVSAQHGLRVTPQHLRAAGRDLRRMDVGWVVVWDRTPNVQRVVLPFLRDAGLVYDYRVGSVLVYRPRGR